MNEEIKDIEITEKKIENQEVEKIKEFPTEVFDYADLALYCHKCGTDARLGDSMVNIKGGLQFQPLPTNNKAHLTLSCTKCDCILSLHYLPAENPPSGEEVKDIKEVENKVEEKKEK